MTATKKHLILYAEDDPDDLQLVRDCFHRYSSTVAVQHAKDGREALRLLHHLHATGSLPCLIILDINMPVMNGREALLEIKNNGAYRNIPVVIFTTSNSQQDKEFAREQGADFITKPLSYNEVNNLAEEFVKRCNHILARA